MLYRCVARDTTDNKVIVRVVSAVDGKVLDVKGAKIGDPISVAVMDPAGPKSQTWYTDENGFIRSVVNDLAIDARMP